MRKSQGTLENILNWMKTKLSRQNLWGATKTVVHRGQLVALYTTFRKEKRSLISNLSVYLKKTEKADKIN